ncbi:gigaxonin-like [Mizuhopecten yessoensis]|uniref:gigaxonin-like n=1 Tax=Mizuhopecten yessoensis TaxID=6573 RepID=UPI000B45C1B0|nr:gigaxonin-like [Mizuhopecten yessoensis]
MAASMEDDRQRKFSSERHARKILNALNENRKLQPFCDGTVVIRDSSIYVQKNVLAAASHYFRLVFNYEPDPVNPTAQNKQETVNITSLGISFETFETILDYIYTSEIKISDENIQDILQAADLLLLVDLKELCCDYLEQCITAQNCLGIREFSSRFSCPWIHLKASMFLDEHFRDISHCEEYLRLSPDSLKEVLSHDTLSIKSEEEVFSSIIRWVKFDEATRKVCLEDLMLSCLRADQMADTFLQKLTRMDTGYDPDILRKIVANVRMLKPDHKCRGFAKVLLVSGGEGQPNTKSNELQIKACVRCIVPSKRDNHTNGQWVDLANMTTNRIGHGIVEVGGYLYAVGGRNNKCQILNSGEKYDPYQNKWFPIAPMEHARVGFGLVAIDDHIYSIGGSNDMTDPLTSGEVYNVLTNKWRLIPEMNLKRVWSSFAAVEKKIYVIAGGAIGKLFEAVECYDTRTETWTSVSPMRERRCDARAVAVDNDIYVFGGFRRIECPSAMHGGHSVKFCGTEIYSTRNDYWAHAHTRGVGLCTMSDASQIYGAVYDGDEVLVIGALDVGGTYHCVRGFNFHSNSWRCVVQNPPAMQRGHSSTMFRMPLHRLRSLQWDQGKLTFTDIM